MTATINVPDIDIDTTVDQQRPWNCILIDDPINLFSFVRAMLMKHLKLTEEKAAQVTLEVHTQGRSIALSGTRDEAHNAVLKMLACGLSAKLEQQS